MTKIVAIQIILFLFGAIVVENCNKNLPDPSLDGRKQSDPNIAFMAHGKCKDGWQATLQPMLDTYLKETNIDSLASEKVDGDVEEIRIWVGFGIVGLRGFIYSLQRGRSEARFLEETSRSQAGYQIKVRTLNKPKSGWNEFKFQLDRFDIHTLESECEQTDSVFNEEDSGIVFFEMRKGTFYRAVMYQNQQSKSAEYARMNEIITLIEREFNVAL